MTNPTVLVVDDETGFLHIVQIILQRAGYSPVVAESGKEGLALIERLKPDAVILDDNMPDITGGEICYKVKHNPETSHIPIILYSAGSRIESQDFLDAVGADAAVPKPCMPADILNALEACLSSQASV